MGGRPNTDRRTRESGPAGAGTTTMVDPEALSIALGFAGGDRSRLEISNDGRSITVRNSPTRP